MSSEQDKDACAKSEGSTSLLSTQNQTKSDRTPSSVCFNVFYDPSLALHLSRGWQLSQLVQGRVATLTSNRFVVEVSASPQDEFQGLSRGGGGEEKDKGSMISDPLAGLTAADLKRIVVAEYNKKMSDRASTRHAAATSSATSGTTTRDSMHKELSNSDSSFTHQQEGGNVPRQNASDTCSAASSSQLQSLSFSYTPINEELATLSWGSTLLAPEEKPLVHFGLTSAHQGATLVLETHNSWTEKLNAMSFALGGEDTKGVSEIKLPKENEEEDGSLNPTAAAMGAKQTTSDNNKKADKEWKTIHDHNVEVVKKKRGEEARKGEAFAMVTDPRRGNLATASEDDCAPQGGQVSRTPSFTSSDEDDDVERSSGNGGNGSALGLREPFVRGRPADREAVRRALEARLAKMAL